MYYKLDYYGKFKKQCKGWYTLKTKNLKHEYSIGVYFDSYDKTWNMECYYKGKYIQWINGSKSKKECTNELENMLNNEHIFFEPFIS